MLNPAEGDIVLILVISHSFLKLIIFSYAFSSNVYTVNSSQLKTYAYINLPYELVSSCATSPSLKPKVHLHAKQELLKLQNNWNFVVFRKK